MKNYQIFAAIFLGILGIKAFSKNDEGVFALTDEQKKTIENEGYKSEFIEAFNVALGKNFTDDPTEENQQEAEALDMETLRTMALQLANLQTELAQAQQQLEAMNADKTALEADKQNLQSKINGLTTQIETLKRSPEDDKGAGAQHSNGKGGQKMDILDDKQLMGMQGVMYSLEGRPYNQRARAALLAAHGYEVLIPKAENAGIDFSKLEEDLGAYYRQQRSQQLQSFIAQLPSVESIFPLESNIQDREVITNLFLGEFSQADSSNESDFDKVVKGKYELQPEEIRMYDVMMAFTFKNLKQLEKQWIGYLNREGSSSIKISFIEYLLQETAKKLHNEREQRRMKGVRKNPVVNVPGTAMEAAGRLFPVYCQ